MKHEVFTGIDTEGSNSKFKTILVCRELNLMALFHTNILIILGDISHQIFGPIDMYKSEELNLSKFSELKLQKTFEV